MDDRDFNPTQTAVARGKDGLTNKKKIKHSVKGQRETKISMINGYFYQLNIFQTYFSFKSILLNLLGFPDGGAIYAEVERGIMVFRTNFLRFL